MKASIWTLSAALIAGCATKSAGTYQVGATTGVADAATALKDHADTLWEQRGEKAKLEQALVKYEEAYNANPTDRHVAGRLVRGYYFLGDAHESEKEAKLATWDKAIGWGKACLAINKDFAGLMEKGDLTEGEAAAQSASVEDVPCLYWTASALGKWGKLSGLAKTLKHLGTVKAYITTVEQLNPNFFHAGAYRYWGAYYSAAPSFAGQDLDKSKEYFDKSIEMAPDYLGTRVLVADYWATRTQDKAAFTEHLEYVVAADPDALPEVAVENRKEQAKAKALLANMDEYFAE